MAYVPATTVQKFQVCSVHTLRPRFGGKNGLRDNTRSVSDAPVPEYNRKVKWACHPKVMVDSGTVKGPKAVTGLPRAEELSLWWQAGDRMVQFVSAMTSHTVAAVNSRSVVAGAADTTSAIPPKCAVEVYGTIAIRVCFVDRIDSVARDKPDRVRREEGTRPDPRIIVEIPR